MEPHSAGELQRPQTSALNPNTTERTMSEKSGQQGMLPVGVAIAPDSTPTQAPIAGGSGAGGVARTLAQRTS